MSKGKGKGGWIRPPGMDKISSKRVEDEATRIGIEIKRDGGGWWWFHPNRNTWFSLGTTNYVAFVQLLQIEQAVRESLAAEAQKTEETK